MIANLPSSFDESISYLKKLIHESDEDFHFVTSDLIRYQLETAHVDNDFIALKNYYETPPEIRAQVQSIGMEESWLNGMAELIKKSLMNWKQNMVPGRAIFYKYTFDVSNKHRYVYLYEFEVRHTYQGAVEKLASEFGDVGSTPDEQLKNAGIFHYRILYMYAYRQPQVAMMFSGNSVLTMRPKIELPLALTLPEQDAFAVLPLEELHKTLEVKDGVFGAVIIGEK
jgi:hypothetical protein